MKLKFSLFYLLITCCVMSGTAQIIEFETEEIYTLSNKSIIEFDMKREGLIETSSYAIRLKNDYILSGCSEDSDCLKRILLKSVRSGYFSAYDAKHHKSLSLQEVKDKLTHKVINYCAIVKEDEFRDVPMFIDDIHWFRVTHNWKIDADEGTLSNKISKITILKGSTRKEFESILYVKFDNEYQVINPVQDTSTSVVILANDRLLVSKFPEKVSQLLLGDTFDRYDCNSDHHINCVASEIGKEETKIEDVVGYKLDQLFFYNHERQTINSQILSMAPIFTRFNADGEVKYYYKKFSLCNFQY